MQMEKHIMSCQEHGMKRWNVQRLCRVVKAMEVGKANRKPSTKPFRQSYCGRNTLYRKSSQRELSVQIKFFLTLGFQGSIYVSTTGMFIYTVQSIVNYSNRYLTAEKHMLIQPNNRSNTLPKNDTESD